MGVYKGLQGLHGDVLGLGIFWAVFKVMQRPRAAGCSCGTSFFGLVAGLQLESKGLGERPSTTAGIACCSSTDCPAHQTFKYILIKFSSIQCMLSVKSTYAGRPQAESLLRLTRAFAKQHAFTRLPACMLYCGLPCSCQEGQAA